MIARFHSLAHSALLLAPCCILARQTAPPVAAVSSSGIFCHKGGTGLPADPVVARNETHADRGACTKWFHEARFGDFVHWGVYLVLARGEWYMNNAKLPGAVAADKSAAVPEALQQLVSSNEIPGAVALVATKDKVLHLSAVGESDLATGRKMKPNDIFWIASMSKPMTSVAAAMLVDDGKLSFDDPVSKYLPEFRDLWVAGEQTVRQRVLVKADRPVTLRDLLTHTSGLGEYRVTDSHWTLADMIKVLAREPMHFQPGTRWSYSTAGMDTVGRIVEVVSGMPYNKFIQTRLFDPPGMKDTTFWISPAQEKCFVPPIILKSGKLQPTPIDCMYGGAVTDHERPPLGGAGLYATAADVAKFYQKMLNHGAFNGHQILKPQPVAEMTRTQTGDLRVRPGMPWGLGFSVVADPTQMEANKTLSPGSFGHGGAFGTQSWADPTRGLIYVLMISRDKLQPNPDDSDMRRAYQQAVAAALDRYKACPKYRETSN